MKMFLTFLLTFASASGFAEKTIPAYGMSCRTVDGTLISIIPIDELRIEIEVSNDALIFDDNSYSLISKSDTSLNYGNNGHSGVSITISNLTEESLEQTIIVYTNDLFDKTLSFSSCQAQ